MSRFMFAAFLAFTFHALGNEPPDAADSHSVRHAATVAIDTNLTDRSLEVFSMLDHTTSRYVRNPNCWASGINLTPVAAFNSIGMSLSTNGCCPWERATRRAGTLISPRHLIYAHHYGIPSDTQLRFVTMMNTVVTRTLANSANVEGTDLQVGVLDANVPTNLISFAKVLPADCLRYFPSSFRGIPSLGFNQNEQALVSDISALTPSPTNATWITFAMPTDAARAKFYREKVSGDSSQPAFLILNDEPVILTVWTGGGEGSGQFIAAYSNQINGIMKILGGGQQLTPVNLGRFTRY